jgi:hypothetical protein
VLTKKSSGWLTATADFCRYLLSAGRERRYVMKFLSKLIEVMVGERVKSALSSCLSMSLYHGPLPAKFYSAWLTLYLLNQSLIPQI